MEGFYYNSEIEYMTEIIKNTLYFAVLEGDTYKFLKNSRDIHYFNIDEELVYLNYYFDFGPLNISCLYKYCCKLNNCLQYVRGSKRIVHYTTSNPMRRVNAAYLMGCYMIIYLHRSPKDIYRTLLSTGGPFKQFIDASQGFSNYTINIFDCLNAIHKALSFNLFNFNDFNQAEYDNYDQLQNGDLNWLIPRKFLAFIGPTDNITANTHPPDSYVKYFLENDVKTVIRLNNKLYDPAVFINSGIEHHDLFFPDGTIPTKQILIRFLEISENTRAAIAVHCKAGLGRTGSLIGAYIIKHYSMTAHETIAWLRICRPGSVIGQQQGWLERIETWLWQQGKDYRLRHFGSEHRIPHHKYGIYSKVWPVEREKLVHHIQKRKCEMRNNSPKTKGINSGRSNRTSSGNTSTEDYKVPKVNIPKASCLRTVTDANCVKDGQLLPKYLPRLKDRFIRDLSRNSKYYDISQKSDKTSEGKNVLMKQKKRNQSASRERTVDKNNVPRMERNFVKNLEQTQGDKLNEIKAKRISGCVRSADKQTKSAPSTSKTPITNLHVRNTPRAHFPPY